MAGVPHGGNMWKNIIIGVLTTVVAYVIVHFLFDKKPGKEEFKKRKAATTEAWESLMIYERTFKNAGTSMACSGDLNTIGAHRGRIDSLDPIPTIWPDGVPQQGEDPRGDLTRLCSDVRAHAEIIAPG